jgi:hypothetical protein
VRPARWIDWIVRLRDKVVATAVSATRTAPTPLEQGPYLQGLTMEPATRIEWATCGLRNSEIPISDNLTPQETTNQMAPEMDTDGAELSCPGSSVVAKEPSGEVGVD